jgi:DNA-3-methyladenine glycosylase II
LDSSINSYYLGGMSTLHLSVPEEFSHELNFQFLKRSPKEVLHRVNEDVVTKLLRFGEEKILVRIKPGKGKLILHFLNGAPSPQQKNW